jgi:hypothetical protein
MFDLEAEDEAATYMTVEQRGGVRRLTLSHREAKRLAWFVGRHIYEGERSRLAYTSATPAKIHAKHLRDDAKR